MTAYATAARATGLVEQHGLEGARTIARASRDNERSHWTSVEDRRAYWTEVLADLDTLEALGHAGAQPLTRPIINLNGTSGERLLEQLGEVTAACETLTTALANAQPHGRDYQVGGTGISRDRYNEDLAVVKAAMLAVHQINERARVSILRIVDGAADTVEG